MFMIGALRSTNGIAVKKSPCTTAKVSLGPQDKQLTTFIKILTMSKKSGYMYHAGWVFGILVVVDGLLNLFWGNDFGFGVFILLLSSIYFPPVNTLLRNRFGISIPYLVKIGIGLFLIWATLAVGALAEGYIL